MIKFQPWVGSSYQSTTPRLMILGESHHAGRDEKVTSEITVETVTSYIEADRHFGWRDYFTKVHRVVRGREVQTDTQSRETFWQAVIFYNYVQEIAAEGGHDRAPTPEMFLAGRAPLLEVLKYYRPTHLIATGRRLWRYVRNNHAGGADPMGKEPIRIIYDEPNEAHTRAIGITHPAGGMSYHEEIPRVREFLAPALGTSFDRGQHG